MQRGTWNRNILSAEIETAARRSVIRVHTLVELGVPESTAYARCRQGGPWQLIAPATVLLNNGTPTDDQLVIAALMYAGPEAVVTGLEALRRHGVRRGPSPGGTVHLLNPEHRRARSVRHILVERTRRMPAAINRDGVPLAPVARAACDAARRCGAAGEVAEMFSDAVQRRLCTVPQLGTELAAAQRRGTAIPRRVLSHVGAGVRSAAEQEARDLWRRTGLPEPWWNARISTPDGRFLGIVDGWWDEIGFAWEINSKAWHLSPVDYAREQAKLGRFAAASVPVLPTLAGRLSSERNAVIDELCAAYRAASLNPRANVLATPTASRIAQP